MKSPLLQLVLRLTETRQTQDSNTLSTIQPTQIINTEKHKYIPHWTNTITIQHKLVLFATKSRVHHGKLPEDCDWCETQENFDVHSASTV